MSLNPGSAEVLASGPADAMATARPASLTRDTIRNIVRQRSAVIGLTILLLLFLMAVFAPLLAPFNPDISMLDVGEAGKRGAALALLDGLEKAANGDVRVLFTMGIACARMGLYDRAEAAFQMGALSRTGPLGRLASWLERTVYRASTSIVGLSAGMVEWILAVEPDAAKVHMIPNASDLDHFTPGPKDPELEARYGLAGRFVAGYIGAMGVANAPEVIAEAARLLKERGRDDIAIVLAGDECCEGRKSPLLVGDTKRRDVRAAQRVRRAGTRCRPSSSARSAAIPPASASRRACA